MNNVCKVCGGSKIHKVLDSGSMPSANSLVSKEHIKDIKTYPLRYYWCEDCSFFQQMELIEREELFGDFYTYQTGVSPPAVEHFKALAEEMKTKVKERKFAVVIASNDGTEIALLKESGGFEKVIGVEPAKNLAKSANEKGLFTINDFFGTQLAKKIVAEHGKADLVIANNVFAHIPDPKDLLLGMKELINDSGIVSIEVHWLKSLVDNLQIEWLYGEHYYVWSVRAMQRIADACGLKILEVKYLPEQQGGSIQVILSTSKQGDSTKKFFDQEQESGLYDIGAMSKLQDRADERRKRFVALVKDLKKQNKKIALWMVSAKSATLLNFFGLSDKEIDSAYDITEGKIGKYIPKANILIKDEKLIKQDMPDYLIVGALNYLEFGRKKMRWYTDKGGKLINPLTCEIMGS